MNGLYEIAKSRSIWGSSMTEIIVTPYAIEMYHDVKRLTLYGTDVSNVFNDLLKFFGDIQGQPLRMHIDDDKAELQCRHNDELTIITIYEVELIRSRFYELLEQLITSLGVRW